MKLTHLITGFFMVMSMMASYSALGEDFVDSAEYGSQSPSALDEATCVTAQGSASTEGVDQNFARKMAIRDALKNASLNSNVMVKTDQSVENNQLTKDSTRFTSLSKVKNYTMIKEGLEAADDQYGQPKQRPLNYEVTLKVCLTEAQGACADMPGNQLQARLAIAPVVVTDSYAAGDISNLLPGFQQELERRVRNLGYQNFTLFEDYINLQPNQMVAPNLDPKVLDAIRDRTGAQFLLLTVIRSLSSHNEGNDYVNNVKRFYNYEIQADSRYLEADWYIVDLMNYSTVHQSRGDFDIKGEVSVGRDRPFGSNAFFATETGRAFNALLDQEAANALEFIRCKPLQSQVIDVRNNEYIIYLNADSGAKVGDELAVYHKVGSNVQFQGLVLGTDQVPGAFLRVKRILPKFAVAELVAKKGIVQVGDVVKAW